MYAAVTDTLNTVEDVTAVKVVEEESEELCATFQILTKDRDELRGASVSLIPEWDDVRVAL